MRQMVDKRLVTVNRLAWDLGGVQGPDRLIDAAMPILLELLNGEIVGLNQIDVATGRALLRMEPQSVPDMAPALSAHLSGHPVIEHYRIRAGETRPVRMGDLVADRDWLNSAVYAEVFRPMGTQRQLALPLTPFNHIRPCGYAVNRSGHDFDDGTLELAAALQPALIALHRAAGVDLSVDDEREAARARAGLTSRELQLLSLVATGMTAQAIGHVERISPRTVRKHLEHIYAKLGHHDRLTAVDHARQLGLLPPSPAPHPQSR
jgi:DNA-binding CsgD family transcriptional regulator